MQFDTEMILNRPELSIKTSDEFMRTPPSTLLHHSQQMFPLGFYKSNTMLGEKSTLHIQHTYPANDAGEVKLSGAILGLYHKV